MSASATKPFGSPAEFVAAIEEADSFATHS